MQANGMRTLMSFGVYVRLRKMFKQIPFLETSMIGCGRGIQNDSEPIFWV
jgi:hypothetical protein